MESKEEVFKRLATKRTNKVLKSLHLLGNLANKRNYTYSEEDYKAMFNAIEEEYRLTKAKFTIGLRKKPYVEL
jgi:hypothetical protein